MDPHFEKRPKIQLKLTTSDKIVESIAWTILLTIWCMVIFNYKELPDTIPIHRNASGGIDGYGAKTNIFVVPLIATIFAIGLTLLNKVPHWFNYARKITPENAQKQYLSATRLIRYLKLAIAVTFLITTTTILDATDAPTSSAVWLLPCIMAIIFAPVIFFGFKLLKR